MVCLCAIAKRAFYGFLPRHVSTLSPLTRQKHFLFIGMAFKRYTLDVCHHRITVMLAHWKPDEMA